MLPGVAFAQANYDGVILGGRTAMMGGAAVAKGSDGATAFVNPAGLIRIPGESFAFSTVAMQATSRTVNSQLDPTGALSLDPKPTQEFNLRILPNTFCLFLDGPPKDDYSGRSRHKYGLCVANTENQDFTLSNNLQGAPLADANTAAAVSTQMLFNRTSVAFAWGFELFEGTNIGVTARVDHSSLFDQTASNVFARFRTQAGMQSMTHIRQGSSWDSSVTVGLTQEISRVVTLGVSLATPTLHLLGGYRGSDVLAPTAGDVSSLVQDLGDFRYNQPSTLRMGLAFAWPKLNFEVNGNFYGAQEVLARAKFDRLRTLTQEGALLGQTDQQGALTERSRPVVNLAAGLEAFLEPDFSVIGGIQTDFSGLEHRRETRADQTLFRQRMDTIHGAVGVVTYGSAGSLLLGFRGFYSYGDILLPDATRDVGYFVPVGQSQFGLSFVISGQISFEAVRDTAARAAKPLVKKKRGDDEEEDEATDEEEGQP